MLSALEHGMCNVACCCLLLLVVACCCLLLLVVACCCLLLLVVACCCLCFEWLTSKQVDGFGRSSCITVGNV